VGKLEDRAEEYRSEIFIIVQDHAGEKLATAVVCTSFRRCDPGVVLQPDFPLLFSNVGSPLDSERSMA
jgi:hypothetical protein